jgi:hypothetical protein
VLVILNALRALGGGRRSGPRLTGAEAALTSQFAHQHSELRAGVEQLRTVADSLTDQPPEQALGALVAAHRFLRDVLLPHEAAEEAQLYPAVARALGGDDPTATMVRVHVEIRHLVSRLGRLVEDLSTTPGSTEETRAEGGPASNPPDAAELVDAQRLLYGLYAVLRLHFAQEEENYFTLADQPELSAHVPA